MMLYLFRGETPSWIYIMVLYLFRGELDLRYDVLCILKGS